MFCPPVDFILSFARKGGLFDDWRSFTALAWAEIDDPDLLHTLAKKHKGEKGKWERERERE
jgi:hypothetical protein